MVACVSSSTFFPFKVVYLVSLLILSFSSQVSEKEDAFFLSFCDYHVTCLNSQEPSENSLSLSRTQFSVEETSSLFVLVFVSAAR